MEQGVSAQLAVMAEIHVPMATAQLVNIDIAGPADNVLRTDAAYLLDFSLTPRPPNARMCYQERWSPHRFEQLGKIFLIPPSQTVQARTDKGVAQVQASLQCHLKPEAFKCWLADEPQWSDRHLEKSLDIRNANIVVLLRRLAEEINHPGFASTMLVELLVGQLAIELARHHQTVDETDCTGGLSPWRLRLIDERLREIGAPPTLTELADMCKLSVRQITRGFRSSRNCSLGDYVASSRIEHAKQLLLRDESNKAIAYLLGFSSPSSFCYAFRRTAGVTPREFRQRVPRQIQ